MILLAELMSKLLKDVPCVGCVGWGIHYFITFKGNFLCVIFSCIGYGPSAKVGIPIGGIHIVRTHVEEPLTPLTYLCTYYMDAPIE